MNVQSLGAMALVVVVAAIIISMGAQILGQMQAQQTTNGIPYNITGQGLVGLVTFGQWIPLISLVIVAAVVIGVIINNLGGSAGV